MRKALSYIILCLLIPAAVVVGTTAFGGRQYSFLTLAVAVFSCLPVVIVFERKEHSTTRLVLIAVLTALSVIGRFLFVMVPAFKPVTAMTVITAMYFGSEAGFMTGSLTALISNFYFGQGPWTPFQMFAFGMLGFFAGMLADPLKRSRILLVLYGVAAGLVYSLVLDVFSTLWQDNTFLWSRYAAMLASSLPMTATYALSNVVFLLILQKPIGEKLGRIKTKYDI